MSIMLEQRADGSVAFFIDGDLQFDSQDERIYHEALALPAVAIAESRITTPLQVLIIGGGDGLTAREVLKSARVEQVDLVDYDEQVLELARTEFTSFNNDSLANSRIRVSVEDAREFAARALEAGTKYDVIISDLTASHDVEGAQLHTIEFYETLRALLGDDGIVAVNAASPSGTPEAYWSIFNSMLAGSLNPRPYRITLPSFAEQGYGVDWGFIVGSPKSISSSEIGNNLLLAEPRYEIKDVDQVRSLFSMPEAVMAKQSTVCAASGESDILVQYLFNANPVLGESAVLIDTLAMDLSVLSSPRQTGAHFLPQEMHEALSLWPEETADQEALMTEVFDLMPALQRFQTREMIAKFLARPASFLAPIDLGALVNALIQRASELPEKLVQELTQLRDRIVDFAGDYDRLFALGSRSLAIIAVVAIIGNLMYPDAVYAKDGGDHGDHAAHADHSAHAGHEAKHTGHVGRRDGHFDRGVNVGGTVYGAGGHWGPWYTNANGKRVRNWIP